MRVNRKILKYADGGKVVKDHMTPPSPVVKSRASPGIGGAIKDFAKSVSEAVAPKSVIQRKSRIDKAIEEAGG